MKRDREGSAEERRTSFFAHAAEQSPFVAVDTRWGRFIVSTADVNVGRKLFLNRKRSEMRLLRHALRFLAGVDRKVATSRTTFLDIGANIGTTTVAALVGHGFRGAVAVEPEPENFRLLELNTILNGLGPRAVLLERAISDLSGTVQLDVMTGQSGKHRLSEGGSDARHSGTTASVTCSTVDQLVSEGLLEPSQLGLMWVDVQGHEAQVLRGARSILERGVPIVTEFHPAALGEANVNRIAELVTGPYSHVVDFDQRLPDGRYVPIPIGELESVTGRYTVTAQRSRTFTNLLFFS